MIRKRLKKTVLSIAMSMAMVTSLIPGDINYTYAADSFDESGRYVSNLPVEKVEGLSEDFCMGADVSSAQALIDAGVRYVNVDGEEQDLYELMANAGINYVRLRLWNDPYLAGETEKTVGNSYGGGVCDINYVKKMALAAKKAGLNVLLDFHYSDFWVDPGKQERPKAWRSLSNDEVIDAIYDFTYDSLTTLKDAGATNITMIQVGNETTSRICNFDIHGEYGYKAFASGCNALRKFNTDNGTNIKSVIHYTNESRFNYKNEAQGLVDHNVDFDVFASSFYPEWGSHGDIDGICDNLYGASTVINPNTGKNIQVMIAEVGYRYTGYTNDENGVYAKYGQSEEGMSIFLRDLIAKVSEIGGIGVFYWEPAWVDIGLGYNETGTGWASDNAKEFDLEMQKPESSGKGGKCATTDLALFKAAGGLDIKAMEALNVFKYVYKGTTSAKNIENKKKDIVSLEDVSISCLAGNYINLPSKIKGIENGGSSKYFDVNWNENDISKIDTSSEGKYVISGNVDNFDGMAYAYVNVNVVLKPISGELVKNGSFEDLIDEDTYKIDGWSLYSSVGNDNTMPIQAQNNNDNKDGNNRLNIWTDKFDNYSVSAYQEIDISKYGPGVYYVSCYQQGNIEDAYLYLKDGNYNSDIETNIKANDVYPYEKTEKYVNIKNSSKITVGFKADNVKSGQWSNVDLISVKYCGKGELSNKILLKKKIDQAQNDVSNELVIQNNNSLNDAIAEGYAVIDYDESTSEEINNALTMLDDACKESSFKIDVNDSVGGSVGVNKTNAKPGEKVKINISTDDKYSFRNVYVFDSNNNVIEVNNNEFIMPSTSVRIKSVFKLKETYYLSAILKSYYTGNGKLAVVYDDEIPNVEKDLIIDGKPAYYMDNYSEYANGWYLYDIKAENGLFKIFEVNDDGNRLLYSTNNIEFDEITTNQNTYYYDGNLYKNATDLLKYANRKNITFYVYGLGRKEISLRFAKKIENKNYYTVGDWKNAYFYTMVDASDELGEGWYKFDFSSLDGEFQIYDSSYSHDGSGWLLNLGIDGGTELYDAVLNGYIYYVIKDGKLYNNLTDTGMFVYGTLDKPKVSVSASDKENTYVINWNKVDNATEYEIQVGGNTIATVKGNVNSYEIKASYAGNNRINVIAKAKGFNNGKSASVNVSVPDRMVSASVVRSANNKAKLSWVFTSGGECDGFEVYAKKGNGAFAKIATKNVSTNSMDVTVDNVNTYTFKVVPYIDNSFGKIYGSSKSYVLKPGKTVTNGPSVNTVITDNTYKYKVTKVAKSDGTVGEVSIIGANKKTIKSVKIAATIKVNGYSYKVTSIGNNAFKKYKKLTSVVIGENITVIGSKAFINCKKLKKITIKSKVITKFGKSCFKGIKKKAKFKVPKANKKAYKKKIKKTGAKKPVVK